MKNRRTRSKIKNFIGKHLFIVLLSLILLIPFVVGLIFAVPALRNLICIPSVDVLKFYGTALGVFTSFGIYTQERRKERIEKQKDLAPKLSLKVDKKDGLFNIKINKMSDKPLCHMYLYDEYISAELKEELNVTYGQTSNKKADVNISDDGILEDDGYPKYIQILCEDIDGNCWDCEFDKVNDCGKIYYPLTQRYIP